MANRLLPALLLVEGALSDTAVSAAVVPAQPEPAAEASEPVVLLFVKQELNE